MTDAQIVAVAITVLAVLVGTLFNNVRISDVGSSLNRRIEDMRDVLRAEMKAHHAEIDLRFNSMDRKLDEILRLMGDHETRIGKLEGAR